MERLIQKTGRIKAYLRLIRSIEDECLSKFVSDPIYRGALLHYLYLLADTCISLAELMIKHRGLRIPQTYAEAFEILGESGILQPDFAFEFSKIAGFRNFLAHDYERIDPQFVCDQILSRLADVDVFLESIERKI
ncbi:MAG: DUF86 domain-containing protein [Deltaproteobacteria bacterium HGW-Deltaproteobacteria-21]|nr:MAG: DUF86 domain-containing protein [Deltaproteobacteria bacterium HGW-Deltaproteobacteria-21]